MTTTFDPTKFGATPAVPTSTSGFDPSKFGATPVVTSTQSPTGIEKVGSVLGKIFPGAQLGKDLGSSAYGLEQGAKGGIQTIMGNKKGAKQSFQNYSDAADSIQPLKDFGDAAQVAAVATGPLASGETALGRIAANTGIGAVVGGGNSVAQGDSIKNVAKNTALGGVIGGGITAVGEGASSLSKNLPKWLTKIALPKLKDGNIDYALKNTGVSTLKGLLEKSDQAVSDYGSKVQTVLNSPKYATETGKVVNAVPDLISQLPNAQLNNNGVVNIVKRVVPGAKVLVDKVADGSATLAEQNLLRQQIDAATKKIFTDNPDVTFNKSVAAKLSNILRANVQGTAKETIPIFADFSKELDLNKAISTAAKKKRVLGGLLAGTAGFAKSGIPGAAEAIALEEGIRSPAVQIAAAKGVSQIAKSGPALGALIKIAKNPLTKIATND